MNKDERRALQASVAEVAGWADQARAVIAERAALTEAGERAAGDLTRALVAVARDGQAAWRVLPLSADDADRLRALAAQKNLPGYGVETMHAVSPLLTEVPQALDSVRALLGARRFFSGRAKRDAGEHAAQFLVDVQAQGRRSGLRGQVAALKPAWDDRGIRVTDALADSVGLARRLGDRGAGELLDAQAVAGLGQAVAAVERALRDDDVFRKAAIAAGNRIREAEARRLLSEMPVDRLKDTTRERLQVKTLSDAGITTVQAVLDHGAWLESLPGLGPVTVTRILGAAETLRQWTFDEIPARIDLKNRGPETTEFLRCLGVWDAGRQLRNAASDVARTQELGQLSRALAAHHSHLVVFSAPSTSTRQFLVDVQAVRARAAQLGTAQQYRARPADPWEDFLARPADYFGMIAELGFVTEDETKSHGDLPEEIVEAIRALSLNTEHLTVGSLRGYQSFGARFALVQRRVIIGDEMGLGKTVEALAVLAHLRSQGQHRALVICPAAVVTNWIREVRSKSTLQAHRLHGSTEREAAARSWLRDGGVGVTTYETLPWLLPKFRATDDLGCVVVDEAHYVKNPAAKRAGNVRAVLERAERAIMLTGTPMENRLEEFANLVGYLQPALVVDTSGLSPRRFRAQVAPAYLRRNQKDVLTELPELVENNELLPLSPADLAEYRNAVAEGNFMAMRQAAMRQGRNSTKIQRLQEIVAEAEDNGRRVIVFSHFLDVLRRVVAELPGQVFGPLTGAVAASERQRMVDQFSTAQHGAVLVSQIVAGGQGLNIQAASVVVICEPQLKPTTEWQAIARAHRMGQLESVQVFRLLSDEGVDQRIMEILEGKKNLFDEFARISATADSAPEAFDISEAQLARQVIAAERERLFSVPAPVVPSGEAVG